MPRTSKRAVKNPKSVKTARGGKSGGAYRNSRAGKSIRMVYLVGLILVAIFAIGFLIVQIAGELAPWRLAGDISPNDARKQIAEGAVVLDVRIREEFVAGHIEKSLFMPLEELTSLMSALPRDRLIITVCRTGLRSIQARYILEEAGFSQVTSLKGGMEAWIAAGFPVVYGEPARNN
ncbi:MAG: rhodanese-like domain-containing protein [Anaerolineales bacterium]|nr:rhodanese-like domain-containing protein [Anaerolineales bacterium]